MLAACQIAPPRADPKPAAAIDNAQPEPKVDRYLAPSFRSPPPSEPPDTYRLTLSRPLVIGSVRADGSLIPFATFDGHVWANHWPVPEYGLPLGMTVPPLSQVPPSWWGTHRPVIDWFLLRPERPVAPVAVRNTSVVESLCGMNPALTTDFATEVHLKIENGGAETIGMAVSDIDGISSIQVINAGSSDHAAVYQVVEQLLDKMEPGVWEDRNIAAERDRHAPGLTSARGAPFPDGRRLIAFRAEHYLPAIGLTVLAGWLYQNPTSMTFTPGHVRAFRGDVDGKGEMQLMPEMVFRKGPHVFWVGREFGYESSAFFVMDVGVPVPVMLLEVDSGGC